MQPSGAMLPEGHLTSACTRRRQGAPFLDAKRSLVGGPHHRRKLRTQWRAWVYGLYWGATLSHRPPLKKLLLVFLLLLFAPIAASAARYFWIGDAHGNWQTADRSSAGLLAVANAHPQAVVRVYAARTVRWRGIFAVHTWIVVKEKGRTGV